MIAKPLQNPTCGMPEYWHLDSHVTSLPPSILCSAYIAFLVEILNMTVKKIIKNYYAIWLWRHDIQVILKFVQRKETITLYLHWKPIQLKSMIKNCCVPIHLLD